MQFFFAQGVSDGIAIGKAIVLSFEEQKITKKMAFAINTEKEKLTQAIEKAKAQIEEMIEQSLTHLPEEADIFKAHLLLIDDPEVITQTNALIDSEKCNAEFAYQTVITQFIEMFEQIEDPYFKERAVDIKDVSRRVLDIMLGRAQNLYANETTYPHIIVADELTPSITAKINKKNLKGFLTFKGGKTSHSSILANSLGIPAIVAKNDLNNLIKEEDLIIFDGKTGEVFLKPDKELLLKFENKEQEILGEKKSLEKFKGKASVTKDGEVFKIKANITSTEGAELAFGHDAEGVGLFRTEFLFMNRKSAPTFEEQQNIYKKVLTKFKDKQVTIRTFDIGGDKKIDYLNLDNENNPFLGVRGARLYKKLFNLFEIQIKSMLLANEHSNLQIMIPMIATVEEILWCKDKINYFKSELESSGHTINSFKFGMMIEVPSAVFLADDLAKHVDFFSIGSNDLSAYLLSFDRENDQLDFLMSDYRPSVIRAIKATVEAAKRNNIEVGLCGELGSNTDLLPIFLGLGLDSISVNCPNVLPLRKLTSLINKSQLDALINEVLSSSNENELYKCLKSFKKELFDEKMDFATQYFID